MPGTLIDAAPDLPADLVARLHRAARSAGVPLSQLELLAQDRLVAGAFIACAQRGIHAEFLALLHWSDLEHLYMVRARAARRAEVAT